jgi:hypothetical protein
MLTILNYAAAFWVTVVIPCTTVPANWEYCSRIDEWLIPDLISAWELKTGKVVPYQTEKDYLNGITSETP